MLTGALTSEGSLYINAVHTSNTTPMATLL